MNEKSAFEAYVIKELSELLLKLRNEFKSGEYFDAVIELELLVGKMLSDKDVDVHAILSLIKRQRLKLDASKAPRHELC